MPSENAINLVDFATLTGGYNDSQEVTWQKTVVLKARGRSNPFHGLMGGLSGMKPITEVMDFKKTAGQEIVVTLDRPLGGAGVQGPSSLNSLVGNEENQEPFSYRCKVGLFAHATAGEQIMETQTVIGGDWDSRNREKLTEWMMWKQADDSQMEFITNAHVRNTIYPGNRTSIDQLGTNDYLNLATVDRTKIVMNANQAGPFDITRSKSGAEILAYCIMGPSKAFSGMAGSNAYQSLLSNADTRGDENRIFKGGLPNHLGTRLYDWAVEDGTQIGPLAAPCAPVAYLGTALPAESTTDLSAITIQGGGSAARGVKTAPLYFQYFENSQYLGFEGVKRAADTTTQRYVAIQIISGADTGKIALFGYTVNNGNALSGLTRLASNTTGDNDTTLTGSTMVYDTAPWTLAAGTNGFAGLSTGIVPSGSPIFQVNSKGVPYVRSFGLGRNALIAGYGNLAPNKAYGSGGGAPLQRLFQAQDMGRKFSIGLQGVWGATATQDANGMVNAYALIVSAYQPPGFPDIS